MRLGNVPAASIGESPVRQLLARADAAWVSKDPSAFAALFTQDTKVVIDGVYLRSRDELRLYLSSAFASPFGATHESSEPVCVTYAGDAALVVTNGGILLPGDMAASLGQTSATWMLSRQGGEWLISAYHGQPTKASDHLPFPVAPAAMAD